MVVAGLSACVSPVRDGGVNIARGLVFGLLPPAGFGQSLVLTQAATLEFGDEQHDLLFYTEITPQNISLVGTLPNGTRLFSIIYDGQTVRSDGNQDLLARLAPEYFLADLQLAQWPFADLAQTLAASNPCFRSGACVIFESADQLQRALSRDGEIIIDIRYGNNIHHEGSTNYQHRERGYRLQVETLDVQGLETQSTGTLTPGAAPP